MYHLHLGGAGNSTGGKGRGSPGAGTPAPPAPLTHLPPPRAVPELTGAAASAHLAASVSAPRPETPAVPAPPRAPPPRRRRRRRRHHLLAGCSGTRSREPGGLGGREDQPPSCRPLPGALAPPRPPPRPAPRPPRPRGDSLPCGLGPGIPAVPLFSRFLPLCRTLLPRCASLFPPPFLYLQVSP